MLYLIESNNYIKIGYTKDDETLEKRINSYKTHNPDFILLGVKEGDKNDEKNYHKQLVRVPERREWFYKPENYKELLSEFEESSPLLDISGEIVEGLEEEIYNSVLIKYKNTLLNFIEVKDKCYIFDNSTKTLILSNYKVTSHFYYDYDEYGEHYNGFILDNKYIIFNYRYRLTTPSHFGDITLIDSPLFEKIKPTITNIT